jgi:hypothetical protein
MDLNSQTDVFIDEKSSEVIVANKLTSDAKPNEKETKPEPEKVKNSHQTKSGLADNNNFDAEEIEELVRWQFEKEFKFVDYQEALPPLESWFTSEKW